MDGKAVLYGDNQSVITSSTLPHSKLSKRHSALAYHRVREAVAAKIIGFYKVDGTSNIADILSKHCAFAQAYPLLKPLLFEDIDFSADVEVKTDELEGEVNEIWMRLHKLIIQRTIGEY